MTNLSKGFGGVKPAMVILLLSIITPMGLYFYSHSFESANRQLDLDITELHEQITNVKKDPNVQVFQLVSDNKNILSTLEAYSHITDFMNHMKEIEKKYSISFEGFNYSNGKVGTRGKVALKDKGDDSYKAVSDFIKFYREDSNALFDLEFVDEVSLREGYLELPVEFSVRSKAQAKPDPTTDDSGEGSGKKDL